MESRKVFFMAHVDPSWVVEGRRKKIYGQNWTNGSVKLYVGSMECGSMETRNFPYKVLDPF